MFPDCLHSAGTTVDSWGPCHHILGRRPDTDPTALTPFPLSILPAPSPPGCLNEISKCFLPTLTLSFPGESGACLLPALVHYFFFPFLLRPLPLPSLSLCKSASFSYQTYMLDYLLLENRDCISLIPWWCTAHSGSSTNVYQMNKISGSQIQLSCPQGFP